MTESLTIVGLGGSLARHSRSLMALEVALDGAGEAGASTSLLDLRERSGRCEAGPSRT
jgi:hypothetical protein